MYITYETCFLEAKRNDQVYNLEIIFVILFWICIIDVFSDSLQQSDCIWQWKITSIPSDQLLVYRPQGSAVLSGAGWVLVNSCRVQLRLQSWQCYRWVVASVRRSISQVNISSSSCCTVWRIKALKPNKWLHFYIFWIHLMFYILYINILWF